MAGEPWTVAVLYGGVSAERPVSIESGRAVISALRALGLRVLEVDVTGAIEQLLDDLVGRCDVAFIALHGTFGEDGAVQHLLERRGIPYTGSREKASRAAMDKQVAKALFGQEGIPTPLGISLANTVDAATAKQVATKIGFPLVVKPVAQGSSKGLSIVRSVGAVFDAVKEAGKYDENVLLETFLPGAELTVGILDDEALPVIQLQYPGEMFDYQSKYVSEETQYLIDPPLDEGLKAEIRDLALGAHRALGCHHFSRVDLRLDANGRPFVLEVNTIPGLTSHSLLPKAAAHAGISFGELCLRMLASASAGKRPGGGRKARTVRK